MNKPQKHYAGPEELSSVVQHLSSLCKGMGSVISTAKETQSLNILNKK